MNTRLKVCVVKYEGTFVPSYEGTKVSMLFLCYYNYTYVYS